MMTPMEKLTPLAPLNVNKETKAQSASSPQGENPAAAMIAGSKSVAAVNLLIQLRNKALDAYSELTRINL